MDYNDLLTDRVLIITGAGRSGTSVLGKFLGSMQPSVYIFEPVLFKTAFVETSYKEQFRKLFVEDYILPTIQGRRLNLNVNDQSYSYNYLTEECMRNRAAATNTRQQCIRWVELNKPVIIVKSNEITYDNMCWFRDLFYNMRFLYIIRNGIDVINSSVHKGWYTDTYCTAMVDRHTLGVPLFVHDNVSSKYWSRWNQVTRCAYVWASIAYDINASIEKYYGAGISYKDLKTNLNNCVVKYEDLVVDPNNCNLKVISMFNGVGATHQTNLAAVSLQTFKSLRKRELGILDEIEWPVKDFFNMMMQEFGYEL